ncbi:MAG: hypothetical protein ACREFT_09865 [Acetobacteraceae bacterium]
MTTTPSAEQQRQQHFLVLGRDAQDAAVRRLAAVGHSIRTIATATRLSEEQIQRILNFDLTTPTRAPRAPNPWR